MKMLIVIATVIGSASFAQAGFFDDLFRDAFERSRDRGGAVTCVYEDTGWEEHWRPHTSCGECTAKHGTCYEICRSERYEFKVALKDEDGRTVDHFYGRGKRRHRAERRALNKCYDSYRYGYDSTCEVVDSKRSRFIESKEKCSGNNRGGSRPRRGRRR